MHRRRPQVFLAAGGNPTDVVYPFDVIKFSNTCPSQRSNELDGFGLGGDLSDAEKVVFGYLGIAA
jgi:hypothetical protein